MFGKLTVKKTCYYLKSSLAAEQHIFVLHPKTQHSAGQMHCTRSPEHPPNAVAHMTTSWATAPFLGVIEQQISGGTDCIVSRILDLTL